MMQYITTIWGGHQGSHKAREKNNQVNALLIYIKEIISWNKSVQ